MIKLNIIQGSGLTGVNCDSARSHIPSDNWDSGGRHTSVILVKLSINQELIDQICFKQQSGDYKWFHVVFFYQNIVFNSNSRHALGKLAAKFEKSALYINRDSDTRID